MASLACFDAYDIMRPDPEPIEVNGAAQMAMVGKALVSVRWFAGANKAISAHTDQAQKEFYELNLGFPKRSLRHLAALGKLVGKHEPRPRPYPHLVFREPTVGVEGVGKPCSNRCCAAPIAAPGPLTDAAIPSLRCSPKYSAPCCGELLRLPEVPTNFCRSRYNGGRCSVTSGRLHERSLPMDTQTVTALCDLLLVVIGIIGLVLVRRE